MTRRWFHHGWNASNQRPASLRPLADRMMYISQPVYVYFNSDSINMSLNTASKLLGVICTGLPQWTGLMHHDLHCPITINSSQREREQYKWGVEHSPGSQSLGSCGRSAKNSKKQQPVKIRNKCGVYSQIIEQIHYILTKYRIWNQWENKEIIIVEKSQLEIRTISGTSKL